MSMKDLNVILSHFNAPIRFACGYGSGIYRQAGYDLKSTPMMDFIFGVTHVQHWHSLNLKQNPSHYSSAALFGSSFVSLMQEKWGAGIYYNPFVKLPNGMNIKYGVVSMDALLNDLNNWNDFYLAGRMQKPIHVLRTDPRVKLALVKNRTNALHLALLLLPMEFTEEDLFLTITGLSFTGDFRMHLGENPHKVYNIVHTQMDEFRSIYHPLIQDSPFVHSSHDLFVQEENIKVRGNLYSQLPTSIQQRMQYYHKWYLSKTNQIGVSSTQEPFFSQSLVNSPELSLYIRKSLKDLIAWPAFTQSLKGIVSAGAYKSLKYSFQKLSKQRKSRQSTS